MITPIITVQIHCFLLQMSKQYIILNKLDKVVVINIEAIYQDCQIIKI